MDDTDTIDACIAILKGMLPQDRFEYRPRLQQWDEPNPPKRSPITDIYAYPPRFSDLLAPKKLHFEVFTFDGRLIAQELNQQNGIIERHETPLADPTCFEKTYDFITRRYLN